MSAFDFPKCLVWKAPGNYFPVAVYCVFAAYMLSACCAGEECDGHGECKIRDFEPVCDCDDGYIHPDGDKLQCEPLAAKPLIYLYPEETTTVSVSFADTDEIEFTHTYPSYPDEGWEVIADPDGTLQIPGTDDIYYGLYWEGITGFSTDPDTGFVVPAEDTAEFLEQALESLGLSWRESNEFIVYWLPILDTASYNLIHFATDEWNDAVPLDIDPEPDTLIRVMMLYTPLNYPVEIPPQELPYTAREGFTVVEWGGQRM